MKIILFGSDDFAVINLKALLASEHQVVACVAPPDASKGRGLQVIASPVKQEAVAQEIPLLQPATLKDDQLIQQLKSYSCDLFIVVAYGKILPIEILSIPYLCAINVHPSLLPQYRGAAPINWAIINGDVQTGVSIIKMNTAMDAGDIFAQAKLAIDKSDNALTLRTKLAKLGAELLVKTINTLEKNEYTLAAQASSKVTLAPKLTKELGLIDWSQSAQKIHNLVRGLLPWPTAYTFCQGKMLKILETQIAPSNTQGKPGEIAAIEKDGFTVATGDGALAIRRVLPESSKEMDARSFLSGQRLDVGTRFSSK